MINKKLAYGGAALLFALGGTTAATGAASAAAPAGPKAQAASARCHPAKSGWHCTIGAAYAKAAKGGSYVKSDFYAYGEHLKIYDHYNNGHSTVAYLKVEGSGTARFTSKGKSYRNVNLSYSENKDVWTKVCTSGLSSAVCTGWSKVYTT